MDTIEIQAPSDHRVLRLVRPHTHQVTFGVITPVEAIRLTMCYRVGMRSLLHLDDDCPNCDGIGIVKPTYVIPMLSTTKSNGIIKVVGGMILTECQAATLGEQTPVTAGLGKVTVDRVGNRLRVLTYDCRATYRIENPYAQFHGFCIALSAMLHGVIDREEAENLCGQIVPLHFYV